MQEYLLTNLLVCIKKGPIGPFLLTIKSVSTIISKTIKRGMVMAEFIFFMFIGMFIGVVVLSWLINASLKNMQQQMKEDEFVDKALKIWKDHMIPLNIEKVKDRFYAYNDETGEFVCQGGDFNELQSNFSLRFPNNGSYIKEKYLKYFPEEVKKAKAKQKSLSKAVANLDNPKNDIVFLDDESDKS